MKKKHTFYCWIAAFPRGVAPPPDEVSFTFRKPDRPPARKSKENKKGFDETWWVHEDAFDQPPNGKQVLVPLQAFADKVLALEWITNEGKPWADRADVYSLATFEVEVECQ